MKSGAINTSEVSIVHTQKDFHKEHIAKVRKNDQRSGRFLYKQKRISKMPITFQNVTITGGLSINSATSSFMSATGGTVTTDGNFKIHTFTTGGTFTVLSNPGAVSYLVVAGGGGGGGHQTNDKGGGGGGAGGLLASTATLTASGAYTVTVGTGGAGGVGSSGTANGTRGSNGNTSSLAGPSLSTVTATGGGGGGPGFAGGPFNGNCRWFRWWCCSSRRRWRHWRCRYSRSG
jgi:hypothetical protein